MLIGHSAGAHLAVMTVLELTLKRLNEKPELFTELTASHEERVNQQFAVSYVDGSTSEGVVTPTKLQGNPV
jgi:acetyl esterase/lipase